MTHYSQRRFSSLSMPAIALPLLLVSYNGIAGHLTPCASSITRCGCTIIDSGIYTVDADLNAAQGLTDRKGCIDVEQSDVKIFTNGHAITGAGTGTGIGIHLLRHARDVDSHGIDTQGFEEEVRDIFLEAAGPHSSGFTTISGWEVGLKSQAKNVISDDFAYNRNTIGVLLKHAKNNNINDFSAHNNTVYGVWIKDGSANNQINCANTESNGIAGIYVGCSATGPTGVACAEWEKLSRKNYIYDTSDTNNHGYGIALEKGSTSNVIAENFVSGSTTFDLFDANPDCDFNQWRVNGFGTANQSCIQ